MKVKAKKIVIAGILVATALVLGVTLKGNKQMPEAIEEELYAAYTTTIGSTTVDITQLVTSTPNAPELSAGMIPIKYTGSFWTITTADDPEWYNYNTGKPAYIMLNDGVYQSELKPNMTNKKLAQKGIELNTSNMGTICLWVPRFAYNSSGTIIYMKPETSVIGTWTIPSMFKHAVDDLAKRDYSLSGVWLEYNTGSTSVTTMNEENSKYGFLANVKAEKLASNAGISYYNTYLTNKGGTTPIKNPTYTTRRILKVINEQYSEPLKGKAVYSTTSKAITVTTTYNKNSIAKILDMNGKQLSANSTTATTGSQTIGDATYTFTIIDVKGNAKQVQVTVSGTGVIMIATATDLINLRNNVNNGNTYSGKQILQIADVTLSGSWTPIGVYTSSSNYTYFAGTYDGGGYSISGITGVVTDNYRYKGLFGYLGGSGTIKNVTLKNSSVAGECYLGGIVGYTTSGTIINCVNEATVSGDSTNGGIGGIVGFIKGSGATITNCINKASVENYSYETLSGKGETGGIVGLIEGSATITNCTNLGYIRAYLKAGGIVGATDGKLTLSACTNSGYIESYSQSVGGMVGYATGGTLSISNCKNTNNVIIRVDGTNYAGGMLGYGNLSAYSATFTDCTNTGEVVADNSYAGGMIGDITTGTYSLTIKNCTNNGKIWTRDYGYAGGMAGAITGGTKNISYCTNNGHVSTYTDCAGGIFGQVSATSGYKTTITHCINTGKVSADDYTGGMCGDLNGSSSTYAEISYCGNTGEIYGFKTLAGGIVGQVTYTSISRCYNKGKVDGTSDVGGILGDTTSATVLACYNRGRILGTKFAGGIAGDSSKSITYCYNTGSVKATSSSAYAGGIVGDTNSNISSNYYVTGTASYGQRGKDTGTTSVSTTTLKALPSALTSYYKADSKLINEGYPILSWE